MKEDHIVDFSASDSGGTLDTAVTEQKLLELIDSGILAKGAKQKYLFSSRITWEVIYDAVMFSEKRRLHNLVGLYIESLNKENLDNVADLLLHHFESGQNHQKTIYYAALAGDRAARMFAAKEAIHSYNRALNALDQLASDKPVDRSLVLEKCGDVYRKSGQYPEAIENYGAALEAWNSASHDQHRDYVPWQTTRVSRDSNLCRKISVSYEHASMYDEATSWINKSVDFLPEESENTAPRVYAAKSAIHFRKGEFEDAVNWGERALTIAQSAGNSGDIAYSHNMIANSFIHMGKLREAIKHLEEAVALYDAAQDLTGMGASHSNLASCYMYSDNLEQAVKHYRVAMDAKEKMQNDAQLAIEHNNLGEVFLMQGKIYESEKLFRKVIDAHERGYAPDALAGYAMMNVSRCNLYNGDIEGARNSVDQALALIEGSGVKAIYLEAQLQNAAVSLAQGRLKAAERLCAEAKEEIEQQGVNLLRTKTDRVLAKVLQEKGDHEGAITAISDSIKLANDIGSKYEEGKSLNEKARMLIEQGESLNEATDILEQAGKIFSNMGAARELVFTGILKKQLAERLK